ncbi:hypothetical protein FO519_006257 [Halicephalobus sp. NKZ332]|nr:hypothetical protein FO519_006257 [Halicephalobus sp. NKZ332]
MWTTDDISKMISIYQGRSPLTSYEEHIETISKGKLKSALFLGETVHGLFALPMIVENGSDSLQKILGPRLMEGPPPNSVDANVDGSIVRRPQLPRKVPISMTTYKTGDGEYLLLGFHKYPQLVMKYTLDVTDPTNLPNYLNPYPYLEYQTDDNNPFPRKCVGRNCGRKSKKQKLLPERKYLPQIGQEIQDDDWSYISAILEYCEEYPAFTISCSIAVIAILFTIVYMMGRSSATYSIPSRESSHITQRSRANSTEQSKKSLSQRFFGTQSKSTSKSFKEEEERLDESLSDGWRQIGKIQYNTNEVLGNGCEGTIVYRGRFDGREAAVKRVITEIVSFVDREIDLLRQSDSHPNVIRYFCSESNEVFRFIALELCDCSLRDYVTKQDAQRKYSDTPKVNIMKQATEGLAYLHQNSIVHRDIKPENILLTRDSRGKTKVLISDFGLCKQIRAGHASISRMSGLAGTDGWIAPEAYNDGASITCLADVFSLGCLYFYILTEGKHPFGEKTTRQGNIIRGEYNLTPLLQKNTSFNIAALNAIENMIQTSVRKRPKLMVVLSHPMFWTNEKILQFFMDVSDRIEPKTEEGSEVVQRLENFGTRVTRNFISAIDDLLKADLKQRRSYRGESIRDLLRALRNKKHHYHEIPPELDTYCMEMETKETINSGRMSSHSRSEKRASISHVLEEASSVILNQEDSISLHNLVGMPTSKQGKTNDRHFYSQFNEDSFISERRSTPGVFGRGGVALPPRAELNDLLKDGERIKVMCLTWNINGKSISSISSINDLFQKISPRERPDVFAVALQELPSTTLRFHRDMVQGIQEGIENTHQTFCWVRQWSQLLIVFIKKHLCLYTSRPEYQFVASSKLAKPFKTKGAIGICFRILQASFVFISCHFSHGSLKNRLLDYTKASKAFNFRNTLRPNSSVREEHSIFNANAVFWFGDLNFRLAERLNADEVGQKYGKQVFVHRQDFDELLTVDELKQCMEDGLIFNGFKEAGITFPPSYKFITSTQNYSKHRIPSYTDRILYFSVRSEDIQPVRYDIVWPITVSDHKSIYGIYMVKVVSGPLTPLPTDSLEIFHPGDYSNSGNEDETKE